MNDAVCDTSSPALTGGQSAHTEDFGTHPIDLSKPMELRAEMARQGLVFHQLLSHEDPECGHLDPLDDPETKVAVRRFMGRIWQAALRAEREQSGSSGGEQ